MKTCIIETSQIVTNGRTARDVDDIIAVCREHARAEVRRLCDARSWTLVRAVSQEAREAPEYARSCGVPLLVTVQWEIAA